MVRSLFFSLWSLALLATGLSLYSLCNIPYRKGIVEARWYLVCVLWMVFFDGLSSMPFSPTWKLAFYITIHIGAVAIPVFWVGFALRFANLIESLTRKWILFLTVIPILTLLQILTNPWHHLFWESIQVLPDGRMVYENGPGYYLWYAYTWLGWLALVMLLLNMAFFYKGNRHQIRILLIAALLPWFVEMAMLLKGCLHYPGYNFLPLLTGLASAFLLLAIRKANFFQSELIAPHQLLQVRHSSAAFLLLGKNGVILDASTQAKEELKIGNDHSLQFEEALADFPELRDFVRTYTGTAISLKGKSFQASAIPIPQSDAFSLRYEWLNIPQNFPVFRENDTSDLLGKLLKLFEDEKIYLNPKLDLNQVCQLLQTNRNTLSSLINNVLGINFSRLVNQYRMREYEHLSKLEESAETPQLTVEARAQASGFSSRSSFYEVQKNLQK